jgi:predicted RNA-binding Zn-ribbon protein involved in translation (DUF1610 family)
MITLKFSEIEYADDNCIGFCIDCKHEQAAEPDAAKYMCEACGKRTVYGPGEIVLRGLAYIVDEEDEDEG